MSTRQKRGNNKVAIDSPIVFEEKLPYPFVHYPGGGAFFAFSKENNSEPVLCSCSKGGSRLLFSIKVN